MKHFPLTFLSFLFVFLFHLTGYSQKHSPDSSKKNVQSAGRPMSGKFYGKVFDGEGKPMEYATVRVFKNDKSSENGLELVSGALTERNGDFAIDNLPVGSSLTIKITAIGFQEKVLEESLSMKGGRGLEKDLGNISISASSVNLKAVEIDGDEPAYRLEIDKKVYNVDKNPVVAGTTAEEVLKNVPSLTVDLDGNVSLRNSAPQIFVDGRPTVLSIDQIPADAIESVEVITNPSVKYDASGGGAGIVNIVLKKSKRIGYNGSVRAGADIRGKFNSGLDLNVRERKLNFFVGLNMHQRKSISSSETYRKNLFDNPSTDVNQSEESSFKGMFDSYRGGFDYFIDIRNTITVSASYNSGSFNSIKDLVTVTDTLHASGTSKGFYERASDTHRDHGSIGSAILYKRVFPKEGKELTADLNYQKNTSDNSGEFITNYKNESGAMIGNPVFQTQDGGGSTAVYTMQTDLINPITDKMKYETGVRVSIRDFDSHSADYTYIDTLSDYILNPSLANNYEYIDNVFAGYASFTHRLGKFGYQAGLRAESSYYLGSIPDSNLSFKQEYPIDFFPNAYISYALGEKTDLQLSYSRRINRPNFFQMMPYIDYSDSLNLREGNPDLKPEYTNALELNLQHSMGKGQTMIASLYYKNTSGIITSYQYYDYNPIFDKDVVISTYENANESYNYGLEFTTRNLVFKFIDFTSNLNFYQSVIDGTNIENGLTSKRFSWFVKENMNIKIKKRFSVQISGEYFAKTTNPASGSSGGRGSGNWNQQNSTVQGFIYPRYGVDVSVRYEFLKNKAASISVSMSDVFKTKVYRSYSESAFFTQESSRVRDAQIIRFNFSYRFGKFDASLFKRKNTRTEMDDGGM